MSEIREQQSGQEQGNTKANQADTSEDVFVPTLSETAKSDIQARDEQHLKTVETIFEVADNQDFVKKILPETPEKIDEGVLNRSLETLLKATDGVNLTETERMQLFQTTLEYYSNPTETMLPLWHSTSSFSLRNGLESGFKGGYGEFTGEQGAAGTAKNQYEAQKDLSISHPRYDIVETFQQIFAKISMRRDEHTQDLSVDSEKITGRDLPCLFINDWLSRDKDEVVGIVARMRGLKPEEITQKEVEDAANYFVRDFRRRQSTEGKREREKALLPKIKDSQLRQELEQEIEHPFPCFITFEGGKKMEKLTTVSSGEKPTHIPFEDRFSGELTGEDIREIRVPQSQISKVQGWLETKGLKDVKIVPIEVFEIKRIIRNEATGTEESQRYVEFGQAKPPLDIDGHLAEATEKGLPEAIPLKVISSLKQNDFARQQLEADAGVVEGYTIEEHTLMMMTQFEKYFSHEPLPLGLSADSFRKILAIHDIGKPTALEEGDKNRQHQYTQKYAPELLREQGLSEAEIKIALALVSGDPIGEHVKSEWNLESSLKDIKNMANVAEVNPKEFFDLLKIFYQCDAGSYTQDSTIEGIVNGKKSLDRLFVFDKDKQKMDFSPEIKKRITKLEKALIK